MTALADSLKRIWSAKSHVPHQTGWGTGGSLRRTTLLGSAYERMLAFTEVARHNVPSVLVIVLSIFR